MWSYCKGATGLDSQRGISKCPQGGRTQRKKDDFQLDQRVKGRTLKQIFKIPLLVRVGGSAVQITEMAQDAS